MRRVIPGRGLVLTLVALFCVALVLPAGSSAATLSSSFNSDAEGWETFETTVPVPAAHSATGGNPGGFVAGVDSPDSNRWWFIGPSSFAGDRLANYGGLITFDLIHPAGAEQGGQIILVGMNGDGLYGLLTSAGVTVSGPPPADTWTQYIVDVSQTTSWAYVKQNGEIEPGSSPPTREQFYNILSQLSSVQILGDLSTDSTGEQTGLDNFEWSEGGDTDGDGIADGIDTCPSQTGPVDNNGCPVVAPNPTPPLTPGAPSPPAPILAAGPPAQTVKGSLRFRWAPARTRTRVVQLVVNGVTKGTKVLVGCKGGGCPFKSKRFTARRSRVQLSNLFRKAKLKPGAKLEVRLTRSNETGKVFRYVTRAGNPAKAPKKIVLCLPPGVSKPSRC